MSPLPTSECRLSSVIGVAFLTVSVRLTTLCFTRGPDRPAGMHHVAITSASRIMVAKPRPALSTDPAENKAVGCKQDGQVYRDDLNLGH
jgi:hypothetical protein